MNTKDSSTMKRRYKVVIKGILEKQWEQWFDGVSLEVSGGNTIITASVTDQTELQGLLRKIHDLHLTLQSVEMIS